MINQNVFLNKVLISLDRIGNGTLKWNLIRLLYFFYRTFPPKKVIESKEFYLNHKDEIEKVKVLFSDEESVKIYDSMIKFRSTYDMRLHPSWSVENMYFVEDIVSVKKGEVFVDVGSYDGANTKAFFEKSDATARAVCMEPDKENIKLIKNNLINDLNRVSIVENGCWDSRTELFFSNEGSEGSRVIDKNTGGTRIKTDYLDGMEICKDATYIKMDIEGSEMKALCGAEKLIRNNKPRLAISIYHKDADMIEIPLYVHSLVPEYKMYVRQHSHTFFDTVLYCVFSEE